MKLRRLRVERLPGIDTPLAIDGLEPGVNVIVGPNAAGKSSLGRGLLALLYPDHHPGLQRLSADLEVARLGECRAERVGDQVAWTSAGAEVAHPRLTPFEFAGSYFLKLEDLVLEPPPGAARRRGRSGASGSAPGAAGPTELDRDIARAVSRELTGGIDLQAVAGAVGKLDNKGRPAARELRDKLADLASLRSRRDALSRREESLPELAARREAAVALAAEAEPAMVGLELAANLQERSKLADRLDSLGPGLDRLDDAAAERLEEYLEALETVSERLATARQDAAAAAASKAGLRLPEQPPSEAEAHVMLEAAHRLMAELVALDGIRKSGAGAERALKVTLARVGVAPEAAAAGAGSERQDDRRVSPDLSASALGRVDSLLSRRIAADARLARREEELAILSAAAPGSGAPAVNVPGGSTEQDLARAETALAEWLEPGANGADERWPARWGWALGGVLAALAVYATGALDAATAGWPSWAPSLAAGAAVAALLALGWRLAGAGTRAARRVARAAFERSGVLPPADWRPAAVAHRLAEVANQRERLRREDEERRSHEARRLAAESALERARAAAAAAQDELSALRNELGYAPELADAGLPGWLQAVARAEELRAQLEGLSAEYRRSASSTARLRERLESFLGANGMPLPPAAPADSLLTAARELLDMLQRRAGLDARIRTAEEAAVGAERERERVANALERFLSDLALEPGDTVAARHELRRRLRLLPEWLETSRELAEATVRCAELRRRLERFPRLLALAEAGDSEGLGSRRAEAEAAAREVESLTKEVNDVHRDIENAASQRLLERASAAVAQARDRLSEHRDQALRIRAAEHLVESVGNQHRATVQPAALELARSWFLEFTGGRYELEFVNEPAQDRRLIAHDRLVGAARELGELSTGTRSQLLLASRVAYAVTLEQTAGLEPMPLFLDEALTTADPERFAAVARALLSLAAAGRQIIYLSARLDDARSWQEAARSVGESVRVIELAGSSDGA